MSADEKTTIEIKELTRVEGHAAVSVDIEGGKVTDVKLEVFEGARLFERIVLGHKYDEMPHITSRVCAICSTGHVVACINAVERALGHKVNERIRLFRELMHLGMIIESHATHICALALPDFLGKPDLMEFATAHKAEFDIWTRLRNLGSKVQTAVGGRPFHPVNLHVGGLSRYTSAEDLRSIKKALEEELELAVHLAEFVSTLKPPFERTTQTEYFALVPDTDDYGYFGDRLRSTEGFEAGIDEYKEYLGEVTVPYSHAKQSRASGKTFMVGSMARLALYGERLGRTAGRIYEASALCRGDKNTVYNNLAQSIEVVEAMERAQRVIDRLLAFPEENGAAEVAKVKVRAGKASGAVECPRGTLYHFYEIDDNGVVVGADMITPSAQNTAKIEADIRQVVDDQFHGKDRDTLQSSLETLVRAYDPCNTCATHMVKVRYS